jgi:hypothetical protein
MERTMDDSELKRLLDSNAAETRRHFDLVSARIEKRFDVLLEALSSFGEQMRAGFARLKKTIH